MYTLPTFVAQVSLDDDELARQDHQRAGAEGRQDAARERDQIGRGKEVGAGGELRRAIEAGRRGHERRAGGEQDRRAPGDPEHVAPAYRRGQRVAEHQPAGRPERHADVVDAERAAALFGRRGRAQQRVRARAVGALADADHRPAERAASRTTATAPSRWWRGSTARRRRRSPCAVRYGRRSGRDRRRDREHHQVDPSEQAELELSEAGTPRRSCRSSRTRPDGPCS